MSADSSTVSPAAGQRCSEASRAAGEPLSATAATVSTWLLVEVPGTWPRDVAPGSSADIVPGAALAVWLAGSPGRRVLFVRRPGRRSASGLAFIVRAEEAATEVRRIELDRPAGLVDLDIDRAGDAVDARLVLVCGHGSRDACCARLGTAVFGALERELEPDELWISSHQGGHRFAANVLVLPTGLHFGRVTPEHAPELVARALEDRIELGHYRGRTCYEPAVQAAEHAVRTHAGLDRASDLRLDAVDGALVRFREADGSEWVAEVEETEGACVAASCGADPEPQRHLVGRVV